MSFIVVGSVILSTISLATGLAWWSTKVAIDQHNNDINEALETMDQVEEQLGESNAIETFGFTSKEDLEEFRQKLENSLIKQKKKQK